MPAGLIIGHEPVGVIHELGVGLTGYKVGGRVLVSAITPCGQCNDCLRVDLSQCGGPRRLGIRGVFLVLIVLAIAKLRAAFCIKHRRSRTFCMVVAGISCLEVPYGTVLGVLSFIVLGRDSVSHLFASSASQPPA